MGLFILILLAIIVIFSIFTSKTRRDHQHSTTYHDSYSDHGSGGGWSDGSGHDGGGGDGGGGGGD
ncbi:hypothetical protein ACOI1C_04355 [Bacillus sp. DJP31]|uniref:hypothetical protein n=1 Tax=Bacillus sp. DJP31 TaxID=3409789 RepID=UPI003BB7E19B